MTRQQKRNLPDHRDGFITVEGCPQLVVRYGQVEFKTPKHGPVHDLPMNEKGQTPKTEENVPKDANKNRIKRAEKRLFKTYGSKAESDIRVRLFENPCVIKASGCRYRDRSGNVTIYYDV